MNDPLAQFRKTPLAGKAAPPTGSDKESYRAFEGKDRVERLRIRFANAPSQSPMYGHLVNIAYDGDYGTNFMLCFGFMNVRVVGKNLQQLIAALEMGTAHYIQEFDADKWEKPADDKAAFIESIEVEAMDGTSSNSGVSSTLH